jgi:hypothetical protein
MRVETMKNILSIIVSVSSLAGCKDADQGDKFIGRWQQVNANEVGKLTANITRAEDGYQVGVSMFIQNQPSATVHKIGKLKDNVLKVEDLENVRFEPATGHLMIGVNEFEPIK